MPHNKLKPTLQAGLTPGRQRNWLRPDLRVLTARRSGSGVKTRAAAHQQPRQIYQLSASVGDHTTVPIQFPPRGGPAFNLRTTTRMAIWSTIELPIFHQIFNSESL
jgi:hypothetical protein